MNKDPAFLFYPSDFLVGTMLMSNEQVGKYIRLMCLAHSKGGYLTKKDVFKICDEDDTEILDKFNLDDEGIYYNERLLSEITKRKKYSDSRRNNRKGKEENAEDVQNTCDTYDTHMENENININNTSLSLKNNKDKNEKVRKNFTPPTLEEVDEYIQEKTLDVDAGKFIDYYTSNGWIVGKTKMKDWKATVNNWHRRNMESMPKQKPSKSVFDRISEL